MACGSSNNPEKVVETFYQNVAGKKFDDAINLIYLGDIKEAEMTEAKGKLTMILSALYTDMEKTGGYKSVEIKEIKLTDNDKQAVVEHIIYMGKRDKKERLKLIKDNGKWKIQIK